MKMVRFTPSHLISHLIPRILSCALVLLSTAFGSTATFAQPAEPIEKLATYTGADREQVMLKGAQSEGTLNVYTSLAVPDITEMAAAFEKKYGIKVKYWRAAQDVILSRVMSEAHSGHPTVDVLQTDDMQMEAMAREKILVQANSPYDTDLVKGAIRPHRQWVGVRLNIIGQAYNTKLIKDEDRPKTYEDLLDPKWKGKLTLEATEIGWFSAVVKSMGEEKGLKLFRDIAAKNGFALRQGHTLIAGAVASGDAPFALATYDHGVQRLKGKGAPINFYAIAPAFARLGALGISSAPSNPHAAVLFYDYMLSPEGQAILERELYTPTNLTLNNPLTKTPFELIDPAALLDESAKWLKLYKEITAIHP
jgi:iron(III) transport system substrate-binding protein